MSIDSVGASGAFSNVQQRFQQADANADGAIGRDEFDVVFANALGGRSPSAEDAFSKLDGDGDGLLTKSEIRTGVQSAVKQALQGRGFAVGGSMDALTALLEVDASEFSGSTNDEDEETVGATNDESAGGVASVLDRFHAVA